MRVLHGGGTIGTTDANQELELRTNQRPWQFKKLRKDKNHIQKGTIMRTRISVTVLLLAFAAVFTTAARAEHFSFSTGSPDGKLGALSRPAGSQGPETETADDFVLTQPTVISGATIHGLITGSGASGIARVEVEIYHVFSLDSDVDRTSGKPTFSTANVPTRVNSPSDHEIAAATRDSSDSTLRVSVTPISDFQIQNTVVDRINKFPQQLTHGEGPASGAQVEIDITFTTPLFLPPGHYFFRPEVDVSSGNFLFLSAPKPITSGTQFPAGTNDLQAWIRNENLKPDWLRIGGDIVGAGAFNMTFSLIGNTVPVAGTPGQANCHGQTVSAMAVQFGGIDTSALTLGYSSTSALQDGIKVFCEK
jgi:hypothetical protein